jgi:hypothetical protein
MDALDTDATEIEITPAMIEAGMEAYNLMSDSPTDYMLIEIYEGMERARRAALVHAPA